MRYALLRQRNLSGSATTYEGRFGAADEVILIDSLAIMLAMAVMGNLNHDTTPIDQLMQMQR